MARVLVELYDRLAIGYDRCADYMIGWRRICSVCGLYDRFGERIWLGLTAYMLGLAVDMIGLTF